MDIVKLAYQIIELSEERDYWQRQALHYKYMHEEHMDDLSKNIRHNEEMFGSILTACLDPNPNSGINKMQRAMLRDPMKGAQE